MGVAVLCSDVREPWQAVSVSALAALERVPGLFISTFMIGCPQAAAGWREASQLAIALSGQATALPVSLTGFGKSPRAIRA